MLGLDRIVGFIRVYDSIRYLTLFGSKKYAIYNGIRSKKVA